MSGARAEKTATVEDIRDHLERVDAAILTEYRGLKVADLAALRRALRGAGAEYKIYKNTLVRRATAEVGRTGIDSLLEGPTAIAFVGGDVATTAKVLRDFARANPALVLKGCLIGSDVLDARLTSALADLPSRDVLLAQFAGLLAAPLRELAGLLKALPQNFAYGLSALIDKGRAEGGPLGTQPDADGAAPADADEARQPDADGAAPADADEARQPDADGSAPADADEAARPDAG